MKAAVVTGASGGIGVEIVEALTTNGYFVVGVYNNNREAALRLRKSTGCEIYKCDLSKKSAVLKFVKYINEKYTPDLIVNNAGMALFSLFQEAKAEALDNMYNVNLFAALEITRGLLGGMISRKQGNVVNISSVWGQCGASCEVDYSTSKAALIGFTKALAKEAGPSGIRVNCICPGVIETNMCRDMTYEASQALTDEIPLERFGDPREIAEAVLFLASDRASYITGQILGVNGGFVT